jgi:hypothetical protein
MKKNSLAIAFASLIVVIVAGCKKADTAAPKDYTQSIKDKTWWGQFTYTGKPVEYYSVHFNPDGSLLWSQLSDNYKGHWVLKDRQLTMSFDGNSEEIKADISDEDKLTNITDNTSASEINSGQIISNPNIVLENTVWKGTVRQSSGPTFSMQLSFLPGTKVVLGFAGGSYPANTYTRSGALIRMLVSGNNIFCILTSSTEIAGSNTADNTAYQLIKQ